MATTQTNTGTLGENLVSNWLQQQGWEILAQQWRCRWGELDIIAYSQLTAQLIFVEVKTRRRNSWDTGGLFAITPQKQAKLWQAAELFLAQNPELANLTCRFDVALVTYQQMPTQHRHSHQIPLNVPISQGEPVFIKNSTFTLVEYIPSAFSQAN